MMPRAVIGVVLLLVCTGSVGCATGPGGGVGGDGVASLGAPSTLSFKKAKTDAARYEALIAWTDRLVEEFGPQVEGAYSHNIQDMAENLYVTREFKPVFGRSLREISRQDFKELCEQVQQIVDRSQDARWRHWRQQAIYRFRQGKKFHFTMEHKIPLVPQEAQELQASAQRWAEQHPDTRIGSKREEEIVNYWRNLTDPRWVRPSSDFGADETDYLFPAYREPITAVAREVYPAMVERRLRLAVDQATDRLGSGFAADQAEREIKMVERVAAWCGEDISEPMRREQLDRLYRHISGPAQQHYDQARRQITASPATVAGVIAAGDALAQARAGITPAARVTGADGQTLSGQAACNRLAALAEQKAGQIGGDWASTIAGLDDFTTVERLGEVLAELRVTGPWRSQIRGRLAELQWQAELDAGYWSPRERELMVAPRRLQVPAVVSAPTAREVTLAMCREIAEAYDATRPAPLEVFTPDGGFGQPATEVVFRDVRDLQTEAVAGGYRCTFTPSATVSYPGSGPQGVIMGLAQSLDATAWQPVTYTFQLTPGGWRSAELGRKANLTGLLRRR